MDENNASSRRSRAVYFLTKQIPKSGKTGSTTTRARNLFGASWRLIRNGHFGAFRCMKHSRPLGPSYVIDFKNEGQTAIALKGGCMQHYA